MNNYDENLRKTIDVSVKTKLNKKQTKRFFNISKLIIEIFETDITFEEVKERLVKIEKEDDQFELHPIFVLTEQQFRMIKAIKELRKQKVPYEDINVVIDEPISKEVE